jgi:hypothetical protein
MATKTNEVPVERVTALTAKIEEAIANPVVKENFTTEKAIEPVRDAAVPAVKVDAEIISKLVLDGDVSKMSALQKVEFYNGLCGALGLNPLTRPFQLIKLNGKEVLYAAKDATDQLRKLNSVSVIESTQRIESDICTVTVKVIDKTGRTDCEIGAVNVAKLSGDALANAMMRANTKAKRRATLSICGLGVLDETELETIPGAIKNITPTRTEETPQAHHEDPPQEERKPLPAHKESTIFDRSVQCPFRKSTSFGKRWDSMSDEELSRTLDWLDNTYKGNGRVEMIAAIEKILIDREKENVPLPLDDKLDEYDPKVDRFVNDPKPGNLI